MSTPESRAAFWRDFADGCEIMADAFGDLPSNFQALTYEERKAAVWERVNLYAAAKGKPSPLRDLSLFAGFNDVP